MEIVSKEQVLQFLPHRDPFLFIDSVQSVLLPQEEHFTSDKVVQDVKDLLETRVHAQFYVHSQMPILVGHFPGNPILPGVVQTEMMAQASCFVLLKYLENPFEHNNLDVALLKIVEAKFRRPIRPSMNLDIYSTLKKMRGNMMSYECCIKHDGELMSEASILAVVNIPQKKK